MKGNNMTDVPAVSEKNKKNEILDAYYDVLEELKKSKQKKPREEKQKKEELALVESINSISTDSIINGLANLRLNIGSFLEELEKNLLDKHREYADIQKAITLSKNELNEVHEINIETDSLSALIIAQKEQKQTFELEIADKQKVLENEISHVKTEWELEKKEYEWKTKEEHKREQLERKREQEEYEYNKKIDRMKDSDTYEANKAELEKELHTLRQNVEDELEEREGVVFRRENEFETLKKEVESFPNTLREAIDETKQTTEEKVKGELHFKMELSEKEMEGTKKLYEQKIEALEVKISEQEKQIEQLLIKSDHAGVQVQDIAVKAIEGASQRQNFGGFIDMSQKKMQTAQQD
jgi:hypothetical protein